MSTITLVAGPCRDAHDIIAGTVCGPNGSPTSITSTAPPSCGGYGPPCSTSPKPTKTHKPRPSDSASPTPTTSSSTAPPAQLPQTSSVDSDVVVGAAAGGTGLLLVGILLLTWGRMYRGRRRAVRATRG